jgi:hypothetical protein
LEVLSAGGFSKWLGPGYTRQYGYAIEFGTHEGKGETTSSMARVAVYLQPGGSVISVKDKKETPLPYPTPYSMSLFIVPYIYGQQH